MLNRNAKDIPIFSIMLGLRCLTVLMTGFLLLLTSTKASAEFVGNTVQCKARAGYEKEITTYCSFAEFELAKPHFLIAAIESAVAGEKITRLRISTFSFSDLSMANKLCGLLSEKVEEVAVSIQKDTESEAAVAHLVKCATEKGAVVKSYFNGLKIGGINSFHGKLAFVETASKKIALIGSGNISNGRKHLDYVYLSASDGALSATSGADLELINWVDCATKEINSEVFDGLRESVLKIKSACVDLDKAERFFVMPGDARALLIKMGSLLGEAAELRIVTQGFNSRDVSFIARLALRSKKKVKILLDDDIYWANVYPGMELMNQPYEYTDYLLPLISLGAEVRYVITNHHGVARNFQHAKAYSFHGSGTTGKALIGSLNATSAALSDNFETMVELQGQGFLEFTSWYDNLWGRAMPHASMPKNDPLK